MLMTCGVAAGLGFLLLRPAQRAPVWLAEHDPALLPTAARQRVIIFIVDTSDYFDEHGEYVQSVVRQQCAACAVHLVNLHGDLSLSTLADALERVLVLVQQQPPGTTALVNLSLGTYTYDARLHDRIRALDRAGVPIIASAGNDHTTTPFYPAAFPEVLGVCSITRHTHTLAAYSNFGPWISLCAPGLHYVTRPLRQGDLASGTSFASPMVAGVLGHLLVEAPCASPDAGLRALRRTATPPADPQQAMGAGMLDATTASQYLQRLYPCQYPNGAWERLRTRMARLGTGLALYSGLIFYFFVSIFALPFGLAFVIDRLEQRAAQRQREALQRVYVEGPTYRQERLLLLQAAYARRHRVRRRDRAELAALLHAVYIFGEPCGWCGRAALEIGADVWALPVAFEACSRCGWEMAPAQHEDAAG
jgi:hypothetical protein